MDKEKAYKLLEVFGNPKVRIKNTVLTFARQQKSDISEIEQMGVTDLIEEWKGLVCMNYIIGQVSLNEIQRIRLVELEMIERKVDRKKMGQWFDKTNKEYKNKGE